jgi:hypothetical protein
MTENGTIILNLRAEGPGILGEGRIEYPPGHKAYCEIVDHLGGLKPGEHKAVPPWRDAP